MISALTKYIFIIVRDISVSQRCNKKPFCKSSTITICLGTELAVKVLLAYTYSDGSSNSRGVFSELSKDISVRISSFLVRETTLMLTLVSNSSACYLSGTEYSRKHTACFTELPITSWQKNKNKHQQNQTRVQNQYSVSIVATVNRKNQNKLKAKHLF